jgi:asparagine synthase (glutamine-hydrolysing)
VPYLDNEIVQYANSLSLGFKLKKGKKWLLKEILDTKGGKIYTQRRKEGFGVPIGKWLREPVGKDLIALLQDKQARLAQYIPTHTLQKIVNMHLTQKQDYSSELFAMLLLEMWLRDF